MKQLIFFSANWCSACQAMKPTVEQISKQMGIPLNKIDTDYDVSYTADYGVRSVPTLILLENGKEIKRIVGAQSENQIKSFING
jgi:thioredoxin-like negative regulator of GroEL